MNYYFKKSLSNEEKETVHKFYLNLEERHISQNPNEYTSYNNATCFLGKIDNNVFCYAKINENETRGILKNKIAKIEFGPIFSSFEILFDAIEQIHNYYKQKGFTTIELQLGVPVSNHTEALEYKLSRNLKPKTFFNDKNWSTIKINLLDDLDTIVRNFSKGHKSAVKKAQKSNFAIKTIESLKQMDKFSEIYLRMNRARNIKTNEIELKKWVENSFKNVSKVGGFALGIYLETGTMIGGALLIDNGNSISYSVGTSDPDYKEHSIQHLVIYQSIIKAKELNYKYFDLGGFNHLSEKNSQIYKINIFKKGFSKNYVFYPKRMYFILNKKKYIASIVMNKINNLKSYFLHK